MKTAYPALLGLVSALAAGGPGGGQEAVPAPARCVPAGAAAPAGAPPCADAHGCRWTPNCFPRCGCPDDYCRNPYPRQCWPPYPPFYRCVPAGDCGPAGCRAPARGRLTWWFVPTPRALHEALWCQP